MGLALLTDLYQLTMAYAAFRDGTARREACFQLTFRTNPFGGGFALACGLEPAADFIEAFRLAEDDLAYLLSLRGGDGRPLFDAGFVDYLRELRPEVDVDGVAEGTPVFPQEPLLRVRGPVVLGLLLETPLLNLLNFGTLIATKAARVCLAAHGQPVIEFGLRRAQGPDGGLSAARAAYVGGCEATSNVLAGKRFGIPVRGTHSHSWVMLYGDERAAFAAYARALPGNCIFLVDTYDSLQGVRNAIEVGRALRAAGHEMAGIRLDSGDLAWLSQQARRMLDEAGFPQARILASNELDENIVASLNEQGARIDVWGVGTRLVTGKGECALGGVYKLSAVRNAQGAWEPRLKLSEQQAKISTPGVLQARRYAQGGQLVGDLIYDEDLGVSAPILVDPLDPTRRKAIPEGATHEDLLVPVFRGGRRVWQPPQLGEARRRAQRELARLPAEVKRFVNPHQYPVGLEPALQERRTELILRARGARG